MQPGKQLLPFGCVACRASQSTLFLLGYCANQDHGEMLLSGVPASASLRSSHLRLSFALSVGSTTSRSSPDVNVAGAVCSSRFTAALPVALTRPLPSGGLCGAL